MLALKTNNKIILQGMLESHNFFFMIASKCIYLRIINKNTS